MDTHLSETAARDTALEAREALDHGRREFLKAIGRGTAGAVGLSSVLESSSAAAYSGPYASAFALDPSRVYLNVGTTGSMPAAVLKNFSANCQLIARDPEAYFPLDEMRNLIAPGFGCDPFELVLSFNTTDGMSKIMNGLSFSPGDEIITTNMEHPGGRSPVQIAADRRGLILRRVAIPTNDAYSDAELIARFKALMTPRTRAIVFSSPIFFNGVRLPEKALCEWAAASGLVSVVDGAHGPGMLALNLHDMGCDFYAGSGHKWQCGPGQTGILYVRNNTAPVAPGTYDKAVTIYGKPQTLTLPAYANTTPLPLFYPTSTKGYTGVPGTPLAHGVRDPTHDIADLLMGVGNPSYPSLRALQECCQLWDRWGRAKIENYVVSLAQYLRRRIETIWGPRSLATPFDQALPHHAQTAITSFNPFSPGHDYNAELSADESATQLAASNAAVASLHRRGIVVIHTNVSHSLRGDPTRCANRYAADGPVTCSYPLRICTHLFHSVSDVDNLLEGLVATVPRP